MRKKEAKLFVMDLYTQTYSKQNEEEIRMTIIAPVFVAGYMVISRYLL